jgi:hypothetical protein
MLTSRKPFALHESLTALLSPTVFLLYLSRFVHVASCRAVSYLSIELDSEVLIRKHVKGNQDTRGMPSVCASIMVSVKQVQVKADVLGQATTLMVLP